jgi:hypothetical protein
LRLDPQGNGRGKRGLLRITKEIDTSVEAFISFLRHTHYAVAIEGLMASI